MAAMGGMRFQRNGLPDGWTTLGDENRKAADFYNWSASQKRAKGLGMAAIFDDEAAKKFRDPTFWAHGAFDNPVAPWAQHDYNGPPKNLAEAFGLNAQNAAVSGQRTAEASAMFPQEIASSNGGDMAQMLTRLFGNNLGSNSPLNQQGNGGITLPDNKGIVDWNQGKPAQAAPAAAAQDPRILNIPNMTNGAQRPNPQAAVVPGLIQGTQGVPEKVQPAYNAKKKTPEQASYDLHPFFGGRGAAAPAVDNRTPAEKMGLTEVPNVSHPGQQTDFTNGKGSPTPELDNWVRQNANNPQIQQYAAQLQRAYGTSDIRQIQNQLNNPQARVNGIKAGEHAAINDQLMREDVGGAKPVSPSGNEAAGPDIGAIKAKEAAGGQLTQAEMDALYKAGDTGDFGHLHPWANQFPQAASAAPAADAAPASIDPRLDPTARRGLNLPPAVSRKEWRQHQLPPPGSSLVPQAPEMQYQMGMPGSQLRTIFAERKAERAQLGGGNDPLLIPSDSRPPAPIPAQLTVSEQRRSAAERALRSLDAATLMRLKRSMRRKA